MTTIPLSRPSISRLERRYLNQVLNSPQLALGPMLDRFERGMRTMAGTRHAIAVSSGTAALHLIVRGLGIGAGDEVITTPFSFVASSNCLLYEGATPRFVDIDLATLAIDPSRIEQAVTNRTRAILAVDVFGLPAPWPELAEIAARRGLLLIDDACEAPGASAAGRPIGSWGNAAAFGFYPNKQITTGEGGCITTDDDDLAALCRSMSNQGRATAGRMEHVRLGYNYRLDELSAALGCAQLERLPSLLAARAKIARWYADALASCSGDILLPAEREGVTRSWFVYVVQLDGRFADDARDQALRGLQAQGIGCAPYFPSIHLQPFYRARFGYRPGDFPHCEAVSARSIALPFFPGLKKNEVQMVAGALRSVLPQLPRKAKTFPI